LWYLKIHGHLDCTIIVRIYSILKIYLLCIKKKDANMNAGRFCVRLLIKSETVPQNILEEKEETNE